MFWYTNVYQCIHNSWWTNRRSCPDRWNWGPAAPSLSPPTHMTSFYITAHSQFSGERGEAAHAQRKKKKSPQRHGPVQQQCVPWAGRAERKATPAPFLPSIFNYRHRTRVGTHSYTQTVLRPLKMSVGSDFGNPLRKFKLVFLGEQSGKTCWILPRSSFLVVCVKWSRYTCWPGSTLIWLKT